MIPGSNLLNQALSVIASTTVEYFKALPRTTSSIGNYVPSYELALFLKGSWQAVPRKEYKDLNLDFQKSYFNFFVSKKVIDVQRNVTNDKIVFAGQKYQCISLTPWFLVDGWMQVLCVLDGAA